MTRETAVNFQFHIPRFLLFFLRAIPFDLSFASHAKEFLGHSCEYSLLAFPVLVYPGYAPDPFTLVSPTPDCTHNSA